MGCCKRPPKMPSKTGVLRAEIAAHAFKCVIAGPCQTSQRRKTAGSPRMDLSSQGGRLLHGPVRGQASMMLGG